jgi:lipopolysaccharide export system protein LptA
MRLRTILSVLAAAAALSFPAAAQLSSNGGPLMIDSDRTETFERERKVLLIGNVDIQQGGARLRADRVTILFSGNGAARSTGVASGFGEISSLVADGDVFYITPDMKAKGDKGVYDAKTEIINLTGEVALTRGRDVATGKSLTVDVANGTTSLSGRAKSVIYPDDPNR